MIKAILFDYGGVIDDGSTWQDIVRGVIESPSNASKAMDVIKQQWRLSRTSDDSSAFWKVLAREIYKSVDEVKELAASIALPQQKMLDLVSKINTPCGLLSNHLKDWLEPIIIEYKLGNYFDPILTSYNLGYAKPSPQAYEMAQKELGLPYEDILFVDDGENNTIAASDLGMKAIKYTGYDALLKELSSLGIGINSS